VLVADDGADPEILTMARRDVQRWTPPRPAPSTWWQLATEGRRSSA
jgi:hypothetical protein